MSRVRIIFMGTPEFAVPSLETLASDDHFEIAAVITQPDRPAGRNMKLTPSPIKVLAEKLGLRVFSPPTVNTDLFRDEILALKVESAAVVAFGQILGQKFLDLFPLGCVNVHASLLPHLRGAAPIQRSVMEDAKVGGVSLQKIVRELDAGDLLGLRKCPITDDMNALDLHDKLKFLGAELLHIEYMDYLRGNVSGLKQDPALVTLAPKISKQEALVNWQKSAREIFCHVRGLGMGPFAYTLRDGKGLKIHKCVAHAGGSSLAGAVVAVDAKSFSVACGGGGVLEVLEVQPESKSKMQAAEYLRGYGLKVGDQLGS